jgi:hypothetical protein
MAAENREGAKVMPTGRPFSPGVSGNPGGRPPGLARLAREATSDGVDTVAFFTLVSHGTKPDGWPDGAALTPEHMIDANRWLADRGFGKAPLTIVHESTSAEDELQSYSLDALADMLHLVNTGQAAIAIEPTPDQPANP